QPENGLSITYQPYGRSGGVAVTLTLAGCTPFTDRVIITDAAKRSAFLAALLQKYPGISSDQVDVELERIAAEAMASMSKGTAAEEPSHATQLVSLVENAEGVELFHTPGGHDSEGYASIVIDRHRETWPINSKAFRRWLSRQFYVQEGSV